MSDDSEAKTTETNGKRATSTLAVVEAMTEATDRHNIEAVRAYVADKYIDQGQAATRATWRKRWEMLIGAIPDLSIRTENSIASDE